MDPLHRLRRYDGFSGTHLKPISQRGAGGSFFRLRLRPLCPPFPAGIFFESQTTCPDPFHGDLCLLKWFG